MIPLIFFFSEKLTNKKTVSQPKLRRIEANSTFAHTKSSQDDVLKSQTYQQFMRNMEHELERLDESEQIYNIGKFGLFGLDLSGVYE